MPEIYLQHYGTKGMKWGQRKAARYARQIPRLKNKRASKDIQAAKYNLKSKKVAKKQLRTSDEKRYYKLGKKSAKYEYKGAKAIAQGAKYKYKITKREYYQKALELKLSNITDEEYEE